MALGLFAIAPVLGAQESRATADSVLDAWFDAEWKRQGVKPSPAADDAAFLRRVTLDLTGSLPSPEDVRGFQKSGRKEKRVEKIDELLSSPKAAQYFAHLWVQWLMGHDIDFRDQARLNVGGLTRWLREAWTRDVPYDELVRAFLGSAGTVRENPPVTFIAKHLTREDPPSALAGASARLFLGRDVRCAQCHDHPFEKITQEEFWRFAAFFRTLVRTNDGVAEGPARPPAAPREDMGELFAEPRFLDGRGPDPGEARGKALARLVLTADGDAAAKAIVDRMWKLLFGRSLAPGKGSKGKPEILDLLVKDFLRQKWSLRAFVRSVAVSRAYQLSSEGPETARREYAAGPLKMMNSVQFMRVWNFAFQWETYYRRIYAKDPQRAAFFNDPDAFWVDQTMRAKELLFPKGRDPEEVLTSGTDRLALKLMNNRDLQLLMLAKFQETGHKSLVHRVVDDLSDPAKRLEELFLLMVSRHPTAAEKSRLLAHAKRFVDPYQAFGDVFWMLFNSSEFIFVG